MFWAYSMAAIYAHVITMPLLFILIQVLVSSVQRILTLEYFWNVSQSLIWSSCSWNSSCCFAGSGLHLVVNSLFTIMKACLYCKLWYWYADDSRIFLTSLSVVEGFFFYKERIWWWSTLVIYCGFPGLLMLLGLPVHSLISAMYHTVDIATPKECSRSRPF